MKQQSGLSKFLFPKKSFPKKVSSERLSHMAKKIKRKRGAVEWTYKA
jgi:hypothetical protein